MAKQMMQVFVSLAKDGVTLTVDTPYGNIVFSDFASREYMYTLLGMVDSDVAELWRGRRFITTVFDAEVINEMRMYI